VFFNESRHPQLIKKPLYSFCPIERDDLIDVRIGLPDLSKVGLGQDSDMGLREYSAQGINGRKRNDRIPKPIGSFNQDPLDIFISLSYRSHFNKKLPKNIKKLVNHSDLSMSTSSLYKKT
jgi:hypothetical protein